MTSLLKFPQFAKSLMTVEVNDAAMDAFWAYWTNTAKKISRVNYLSILYLFSKNY